MGLASRAAGDSARETAQHRRARRLRGEARALLRVAKAKSLLNEHHSCQRPYMSGQGFTCGSCGYDNFHRQKKLGFLQEVW